MNESRGKFDAELINERDLQISNQEKEECKIIGLWLTNPQ